MNKIKISLTWQIFTQLADCCAADMTERQKSGTALLNTGHYRHGNQEY